MNPIEKLMADLLMETAEALLAKVRAGEATPADIKNIRELLKDNNITTDCSDEANPLSILDEELPFTPNLSLVGR